MQGPSIGEEEDSHIAAINIIPLVDVVLVLLIIFMVTTVFQRESALKLDLPKGSRADQAKQPPAEITVDVDEQKHVMVNNKPSTIDNLQKDVQAVVAQNGSANKKSMLVLRGSDKVLYGTIMPVLDEISRTNVDLTLAIKPGTKQ
jgi:biopolymer transport protein ExbD